MPKKKAKCAFSLFTPQAEAIAKLLDPYAEVVIHNIKKNKIEAIFNSYSGRKAGDDSLLDDETNWHQEPEVTEVYEKINFDGRKLKSITSVLRDPVSNCPIGLMCVNFDISEFEKLDIVIQNLMSSNLVTQEQPKALFKNDWQERINRFVQEYREREGITSPKLKIKERRKIVKKLKEQGAFRVKYAADHVANVLDISRATVYKYLQDEESS